MNKHKIFEEKINEVERELKKLESWSDSSCRIDLLTCTEAFCSDQLEYTEWLQYVFLPGARKMIGEESPLPKNSMLGVKAMREWDYMSQVPKMQRLTDILGELDDICNSEQ